MKTTARKNHLVCREILTPDSRAGEERKSGSQPAGGLLAPLHSVRRQGHGVTLPRRPECLHERRGAAGECPHRHVLGDCAFPQHGLLVAAQIVVKYECSTQVIPIGKGLNPCHRDFACLRRRHGQSPRRNVCDPKRRAGNRNAPAQQQIPDPDSRGAAWEQAHGADGLSSSHIFE